MRALQAVLRSPSLLTPSIHSSTAQAPRSGGYGNKSVSAARVKQLEVENLELRSKIARLESNMSNTLVGPASDTVEALTARNNDLEAAVKGVLTELSEARAVAGNSQISPLLNTTSRDLEALMRIPTIAAAWNLTIFGSSIEQSLQGLKTVLDGEDQRHLGGNDNNPPVHRSWADIEAGLTPLPRHLGKGKQRAT